MPIGSPSGVKPAGTEIEGQPVMVIVVAGSHPVDVRLELHAVDLPHPVGIDRERRHLGGGTDQVVEAVEELDHAIVQRGPLHLGVHDVHRAEREALFSIPDDGVLQ